MAVSLHQLRILIAVASEGTISRAAAVLHLTQPTLSIQLKQLSETLGQPLFELAGRRLHLTDAGYEVLSTARNIDDQLEALRARLAAGRALEEGRLRVAIVSTAEYFMPRLLGEFHQRYPGIDISLAVLNRAAVLERLEHNADDLYVMARPPHDRAVRADPFGRNPLVVVAAPHHPLAARQRISPRDLSDEAFVVREIGSGTRLWGDEWLARRGVVPKARLELGSNEAVKQAVRGGFGLAVLSAHSLLLELAQGLIVVLHVNGSPIRSSWHLVSRVAKPLMPAADAFRRYAKQAMPGVERTLMEMLEKDRPPARAIRKRGVAD